MGWSKAWLPKKPGAQAKPKRVMAFGREAQFRAVANGTFSVGARFGFLTVVGAPKISLRSASIPCMCDCGVEILAPAQKLIQRHIRSCGCRRRGVVIHGEANGVAKSTTKEYRAWRGIIARCVGKGHPRYAGRGIGVCEEWRKDFGVFLAAVGRAPTSLHTIDRIDNDGGYEPGNVRWATRQEQSDNRPVTSWMTIKGVRKTVAAWAEDTGIPYTTLLGRFKREGAHDGILRKRWSRAW